MGSIFPYQSSSMTHQVTRLWFSPCSDHGHTSVMRHCNRRFHISSLRKMKMHHSANFIHLNRIQYKTQQNKQNKIIVIVVSYNMRCGPVRAHHIPYRSTPIPSSPHTSKPNQKFDPMWLDLVSFWCKPKWMLIDVKYTMSFLL